MGVTLYHFAPSAPSRCALLACKAVGLDVDIQIVNLFNKEQNKPEFLKVNPQHCVPTLVDGDFVLWESRAIASYVVSTYGKDDKLYPKDPKKRAVVDQRLFFDSSTLYPRLRAICFPILFLGENTIDNDKRASLEEAIGFMDVFLDGKQFMAGNDLTIADFSLMTSLSSIVAVGWDLTPYANVAAWFARCTLAIPGYTEHNQTGAEMFGTFVKSKLAPGQI